MTSSIDTSISILTLADVKNYIEGSTTGSTQYDYQYVNLINSVSHQFNMWTERILRLNYYPGVLDPDDYDGNGKAFLYLRQCPVSTSGVVVYIDDTYQWTTDSIVPSSDVKINYSDGRLFLYNEIFKVGYGDIRVSYSAGFSSSAIPDDLQRAALEMTQFWWNRQSHKDRIGVRSESYEGGSRTFETDMPWSVQKVLEHYRLPRYG